jgi:hypothetical protein
MPTTYRIALARTAGVMMAVVLAISTGYAQFHVPKIPGAQKTSETKPSRASTVEVVSSANPESAPPGGHGQVVLTGQNFKDGMKLQFNCKGANFPADSTKVDSPTRLEAQITVPVGAQEGPCDTSDSSTFPSQIGKGTFAISNSANMPIAISLALMGEGDMQWGDIMTNMSKMMMAAAQNGGKVDSGTLQLEGGSIKYVKGSTTSFNESTSAVKSLDPVLIYGSAPSGYFKITFNNGKIYTLGMAGPGGGDPNATLAFLKKKLGK